MPTDRIDPQYPGIDVSKDPVELALGGEGGEFAGSARRFPNTPAGLQALLEALRRGLPQRVALEATGAYHQPLVRALAAAALPVAVLNPAQVNAFRQRPLGRNKTDRQDALLLARFAGLHAPELERDTPPPAEQQELRQELAYRDAVSTWRTVLLNQWEANAWAGAPAAAVPAGSPGTSPRWRPASGRSTPKSSEGSGACQGRACCARSRGAAWGHLKAAAACAGVHPAISASGRTERRRLSRTGSGRLRRYLYCGALSARRWDPELRAFYERLVARGKPKKAAIVAVMPKLLRRLMGRLRAFQDGRPADRPARPRSPAAQALALPA